MAIPASIVPRELVFPALRTIPIPALLDLDSSGFRGRPADVAFRALGPGCVQYKSASVTLPVAALGAARCASAAIRAAVYAATYKTLPSLEIRHLCGIRELIFQIGEKTHTKQGENAKDEVIFPIHNRIENENQGIGKMRPFITTPSS